MNFMNDVFSSLTGKKEAPYLAEYKKYKKTLERNPNDHDLRVQLIKFCLVSHHTEGIPSAHLTEALAHYGEIIRADHFDPQVYYFVGRYYQQVDKVKAQTIFLAGIRHFNRYVGKNPAIKSDFLETAYAIALNFVTLQYGQVHPDLEKFFKIIHKSYPLHNKRVELENELRKPSPNADRIKELARELLELKEATEAAHKAV